MSSAGGAVQRRPRALPPSRWILLGVVLVGVVFSCVYPMRRYFDVRARIVALQREERVLAERAQQLQRERTLLQSDAEVERIARELGMVRPGEVAFVVVRPRADKPAPKQPVGPSGFEPPRAPDSESVVDRWWRVAVEVTSAVP